MNNLSLDENNIYKKYNNNVLSYEEKDYLRSILIKEKNNICESRLKYKNQKYLIEILDKQYNMIIEIENKLNLK